MENSIEVTVDEKSFSQSGRSSLQNARYLGVISMDRASIKAADLFETRGGYIVKIDRQTAKAGEMTGSERRDALTNLCKAQKIDIALLGRIVKTEAGSTVAAVFTGRAKVEQSWVMDMLECKTNSFNAFGGDMKLNVGVYNANAEAQLEEMVGAEIGTKILAAIGRDKTGAPPGASATTEVKPSMAVQNSSIQNSPALQTGGAEFKPMTHIEIQKALSTLKYQIGVPDGVMGPRSINALKKFQGDNGLPQTGQINSQTQSKLQEKIASAAK